MTDSPPATGSAGFEPGAQASPWSPVGPVTSLVQVGGLVTVVEGSTFCLSGRSGDILVDHPHGLFIADTRALSRFELAIDGGPVEPLTVASDAPYETTFVGRVHPRHDEADSDLLVFRRRHVGHGMREQLSIHSYADHERPVTVEIHLDVDFADLFEVKDSRVVRRGTHRVDVDPTRWMFAREHDGMTKSVTLTLSVPADAEPGTLSWRLQVPARGRVDLCIGLEMALGDEQLEPRFRCGHPDEATEPARRRKAWHTDAPIIETDSTSLGRAVRQSIEDLGSLRIFDPEHPDRPVIAAGAPWFMTLFGRDSLLTSWMALVIDPSLAVGVLETLARFQGTVTDDRTEEEPGRILHEVRFDRATSLALGGGSVYYGTADATPLFVMLAGELGRWGIAAEITQGLLPHIDRALAWIETIGDRDGDGFVEYQRRTPKGLANQGWKDSWDGISFADGRLPDAPIALCEVQGYTYAAYLARAQIAATADDHATEASYLERAARLREAFNRDFWLEDLGWFAVGLDADKQPIDALTSNIGHCLWTGIVDEDKAALVADHLLSPEMFTGWGIRTLATTMARYNPVSYHNGSVWPHDSAICAAGLMRYGFVEHAHRVTQGLLDVADALDGRLPELFAGLDRSELSVPAAYPTSCSPQAWAAAAPLLLARSMLRFDPCTHDGHIHLAPSLPPSVGRLVLHGTQASGRSLTLGADHGAVTAHGLGDLALVRTPRRAAAPVCPGEPS